MIEPSLKIQIASTLGAILCLLAYAGMQLKLIDHRKVLYNVLNIFGSGILAFIAFRPLQAGFLLMEGAWLILSFYALYKSLNKLQKP